MTKIKSELTLLDTKRDSNIIRNGKKQIKERRQKSKPFDFLPSHPKLFAKHIIDELKRVKRKKYGRS